MASKLPQGGSVQVHEKDLLDFTAEAAVDYEVKATAGFWTQPAAPPPTTAELRLDQGQTRVDGLLLRANVPSTITLKGPKDLLFHALAISLVAKPLSRNLAAATWGSSRSRTDDGHQEILLAGPARIHAVGVRPGAKSKQATTAVLVETKQAGAYEKLTSLTLHAMLYTAGVNAMLFYSGFKEQAAVTDSVRFDIDDESALLLIRSDSLPSRVGLSLGDDTPAQLFPAEMEEGGTATSRDLTAQANAAWRRGIQGETAAVQLRLTSQTDGVVQVDLAGTWGRSYASEEWSLSLDPLTPSSVTLNWPLETTPDALAWMRLSGETEGGRRLSLVPGTPAFHVRATERLEVAQAIRLVTGDPPVAARQLLAIWLLLARLPQAEERLELRVTAATGTPAFPADEPIARLDVTLPADRTAYQAQPQGYWYRAPFEKPVALDGTQAAQPLFVVVAGRESGTLLAHRSLPTDPATAARIPAAGGAGASLVRNLERTGSWEMQGFNQQAAQWLIDLELAPTEAEGTNLIQLTVGNGAAQSVPLAAPGRISLETAAQLLQRPVSGSLTASLTAAVRGQVKAQLFLYKPSKG